MVQNIPGKTFPTVWKQNFSLKTQMVQNIPGKSFPQQFENRIFVENSYGTKHSREKFPPTVWKQNFLLKTQMVQNIPGKVSAKDWKVLKCTPPFPILTY